MGLREGDSAPFRGTVVYSCRHDQRYDHQCEDSRGQYLFDVIQATGEPVFYRGAILSALCDPADDDDQDQLFKIAWYFAQSGDEGVRRTMYSAFRRNALMGDPTGADEIVALDSIDGLLFVIASLNRIEETEDNWLPGWWIGILENRIGKEATWEALDQAAVTNLRLRKLLEHKREEERKRQEARNAPKIRTRLVDVPYAEMRDIIHRNGSKTPRVSLAKWGYRASADDLLAAATDLLAEHDDDRLLSYLRLFRHRPFPLDPGRLIALSMVDNEQAAWEAKVALAPIHHPQVRVQAMTLLSHPLFAPVAIGMLSSNYESGDELLVERTLETSWHDRAVSHHIGWWALDFTDAHPDISGGILHLVYETTPCTNCRESSVKRMADAGSLPDCIREECRWDANVATRELVATPH